MDIDVTWDERSCPEAQAQIRSGRLIGFVHDPDRQVTYGMVIYQGRIKQIRYTDIFVPRSR